MSAPVVEYRETPVRPSGGRVWALSLYWDDGLTTLDVSTDFLYLLRIAKRHANTAVAKLRTMP